MRGLLIAAASALVVASGCGRKAADDEGDRQGVAGGPRSALSEVRAALGPGDQLPAFGCRGWLNGGPPEFNTGADRVYVVDVWASWCSGTHEAAPALVVSYRKFAKQGVEFVSLTAESRKSAESFVKEFSIPWATGYAADLETINALGAYNREMPTPGYEVRPTLYIADASGKVLWCDRHGRLDHGDEGKAKLIAALEAELHKHVAQRVLKGGEPPRASPQREVKPTLAPVNGTVTMDGKPLANAVVVFQPHRGRPSLGFTDEKGRYELYYTSDFHGAIVGRHMVTISTFQDAYEDENGKFHPEAPERIPVRYNVNAIDNPEMNVEVTGPQTLDFKLKSTGEIIQPERVDE